MYNKYAMADPALWHLEQMPHLFGGELAIIKKKTKQKHQAKLSNSNVATT